MLNPVKFKMLTSGAYVPPDEYKIYDINDGSSEVTEFIWKISWENGTGVYYKYKYVAHRGKLPKLSSGNWAYLIIGMIRNNEIDEELVLRLFANHLESEDFFYSMRCFERIAGQSIKKPS